MSKIVIKFRGKRVDNGEWAYGYYAKGTERHCILPDLGGIKIDVIPETVGQLTPFKDFQGTYVYEGDVIEKHYGSSIPRFLVSWSEERGMWVQQDGYNEPLHEINFSFCQVKGSIHTHPELITKQGE